MTEWDRVLQDVALTNGRIGVLRQLRRRLGRPFGPGIAAVSACARHADAR